jgi:hypothetical protein
MRELLCLRLCRQKHMQTGEIYLPPAASVDLSEGTS